MTIKDIQKQTNINIQEKANLIWNIATHIYGLYKEHEYGKVILPFTVLKRFDDALKDTKAKVVEQNKKLVEQHIEGGVKDGVLKIIAKHDFYNVSPFDFEKLAADPDNIESNFDDYLTGFSDNVKDIIANFKFTDEVKKLAEANKLYVVLSEFASKKADMSPDKITSVDMGYIFEELIRKFSESYDEAAGAHFTARDIIYLMTELLIAPERDEIKVNGCTKTAYDMAMGTSQMLGCLEEKLKEVNENANLTCFGQEFNPETYAIAKADMLIKGGNASGMKYGDTLDNDQFTNYEFDYIISNPPFGIDWASERKAVEDEAKLGTEGRFGSGLPSISDGQTLFMQNGIKKLKDTGRMAIIQNASTLYNGGAGKGVNLLRQYLLEEDLVEAIIELPENIFYNTPINTYIWIITKNKSETRKGYVQLIDASNCFIKRRKNIGEKKNDLDLKCIELIMNAYNAFKNDSYKYKEKTYDKSYSLIVKSKIFENDFFGYNEITIQLPKVENGSIVTKKGKIQYDSKKSFVIDLPFNTDIEKYLKKYIYPDFPDSFYDKNKTVIGYEIPFVRLFHELIELRPSEKIYSELVGLQNKKIEDLLSISDNSDDIKKSTGIKYLDEIPASWNITFTRNLFDISNEKANQEQPTVLTLARSGVKVRDISTNEGQLAESYDKYNPVKPNDLLLNPMDLISGDNCSISYVSGVISPAYINLRPKKGVNSEYYNYYFKYQYWIMAMFEQGKGVSFDNRWTMNKDACLSYLVPSMPYEEQTKIAETIKKQTEKIDEIISLEEEKIKKLKELKQSIIAEYVVGKKK